MGKKIASLYAEIGADTTKLKSGLDETKGQLTQAKAKMDNFKASALPAIGIVAGFGAALKGAYDIAKEGAALEFAAGKFDRLADSIGVTSDALLDDLKKATRGTVSDMQLMASAGDFMALGLAKSREEVVRLTRVAGALGMDMNQLVLTLTNQTTMRFDALGVSVDGFDEKVEALKKTGLDANKAFTEAFLQQAEEQIGKVGDKADTAAGQVARMEASFENLGNTLKNKLVVPLGNIAVGLNALMTGEQQVVTAIKEHETVVRANSKSYAEYSAEMERVMDLTKTNAQVVLGHAGSLEEVYAALGILNKETYRAITVNGNYVDMQERVRDGLSEAQQRTADFAAAHKDAIEYQEMLTERQEKYAEAVDRGNIKVQTYNDAVNRIAVESDDAATATENLKTKINGLDDINPQFGNKIQAAIDRAKVALAGGVPIQQTVDQLLTYASTLDPNDTARVSAVKTELENAYVAAQQVQVEAGLINTNDAAKNVSETLGVSLSEAYQLIKDMDAGLRNFPADIDVRLNIIDTYGMSPNHPGYNIKTKRDETPGEERAAGGPVYGGGAYWVGERGPEPFVPAQDGRVLSREDAMEALARGSGGGVTITQNIYTQLDYAEAAVEIAEIMRRNK